MYIARDFVKSERNLFLLSAFFIGIVASVVYTYPLVRDWNTHVPGYEFSDAFESAWVLWWFDKSVTELKQSPSDMNLIYYPTGMEHPKEMTSLSAEILAWPGIGILGIDPIILYNAHIFASFVLTFFFMAWLCFDLTSSRAAALMGAFIFTFSTNKAMHVLLGHLTLSLTYIYPLVVLTLMWVWKKPTILRGIIFGLSLSIACLVDLMPLFYGVGPIFVTLLLFLFISDRKRFISGPMIRSFWAGLFIAIIVVLPFYLPLLKSAIRGDLTWYESSGIVEFSADALAFFVPPRGNPLVQIWPGLSHLSNQIYEFGISYYEGTVYFGWIAIILGLIGVIKLWESRLEIKYWTTVVLVSSVLAIGPWLRVKSQIIHLGKQPLLMPYAALLYLPFVSWGRTPGRFGLTAVFALAILAAFGMKWLGSKITNPTIRVSMAIGLMALIFIDSIVQFPWPMTDAGVPDYYLQISQDERAVAVLDIPTQNYAAAHQYMLYQMEHGHAIVGGWRDRRPPAVKQSISEIALMAEPGGDLTKLAQMGIGYVVLHKEFMGKERLDQYYDYLIDGIGIPINESEQIVVFVLDNVREIAPGPVLIDN